MPEKAEQEKIGRYFEGIDNLITLHQCKFDCYTNLLQPATNLPKINDSVKNSHNKIDEFAGF